MAADGYHALLPELKKYPLFAAAILLGTFKENYSILVLFNCTYYYDVNSQSCNTLLTYFKKSTAKDSSTYKSKCKEHIKVGGEAS